MRPEPADEIRGGDVESLDGWLSVWNLDRVRSHEQFGFPAGLAWDDSSRGEHPAFFLIPSDHRPCGGKNLHRTVFAEALTTSWMPRGGYPVESHSASVGDDPAETGVPDASGLVRTSHGSVRVLLDSDF